MRKQYGILPNPEGREVTSLKRCKKRGASKEFIAHKGFQSLDDGRIKKHLRICVLQAQRICLTRLLYTLQQCQYSNQSGETVFDADAFDNKFTSFETRMAACVFRKIFAITDPTSNILQSELIPICTF